MTSSQHLSISLTAQSLLAFLAVVLTAVAIRLAELPLWNVDRFMVGGEHLMATHDAYTWLTGIKGIGNFVNEPFTRFLGLIHEVTGLSLADVGFWGPVYCVPLLAIPVCLLARALGLAEGGLAFGILVTSGFGFLVRTRLGFCDTDIVNLVFPLGMVSCMAAWMDRLQGLRGLNGLHGATQGRADSPMPLSVILLPVLAGLCAKAAVLIYSVSSSILLPALGMSVCLGLLLFQGQAFIWFGIGWVAMFGLGFGSWISWIVVAAWLAFALHADRNRNMPLRTWLFTMALLLIVLAVFSDVGELARGLVNRLFLYMKGGTPDMILNITGLQLPDIARSVRETRELDWSQIGPCLGGNWFVFLMGLSGFGFVCWRRPALLVFLPFLGLGLASIKLGDRFTMYGTVSIGMGLGLGLGELLAMLGQNQWRRWMAQLVVASVALWPAAQFMKEAEPVPVLPPQYAQTLMGLKSSTAPDALLWQWWDYGYAAQYYAERATMGDGARQSGPWLYPLALAHCATSSVQAGQVIRYFGQEMLSSGLKQTDDTVQALFTGNPIEGLQAMDAWQAKAFLDSLGRAARQPSPDVPQYFVLSWENLRLAEWISYYGYWDIVAGRSAHGLIQQLGGGVPVVSKTGQLSASGLTIALDSLDIIEKSGPLRHTDWQNGSGLHLIINRMARQVFIMETRVYQSMMMQMLLFPPEQFAPDFELVADHFPWVRVYRVR